MSKSSKERKVNCVSDGWSVIFDVFPAYKFGGEGEPDFQPSFHVFLEDKHPEPTLGEPVTLFCTENTITNYSANIFALFRGQYWFVEEYIDFGIGTSQPTLAEIQVLGTKKRMYRSIDDF